MASNIVLDGGQFARALIDADADLQDTLMHAATDATLARAEMYLTLFADPTRPALAALSQLATEIGRRRGLEEADRLLFKVAGPDLTDPGAVRVLDEFRGELQAARA